MEKMSLLFVCVFAYAFSNAQFVARADIKEPIDGICDAKNVYAIFPMLKGQTEATCLIDNKDIEKMLQDSVAFLKDKPDYEDKGMVSIIINCEAQPVKVATDNKTKSAELDAQIVTIFTKLKSWTAAKLKNKKVDSIRLWSFTITKGIIHLN